MASLSQKFSTDEIHNLMALARVQAASVLADQAPGSEELAALLHLTAAKLGAAVTAAERRGDKQLSLV